MLTLETSKSQESAPYITIRSVTQAKAKRKKDARDLGKESGVVSSPCVLRFSFHHLCTLLSWGLEQARFSHGRKFTLSVQLIKPCLVIVPQSRCSCEKERKNTYLLYIENGKRQMGCLINSGFSNNDRIVWNVILVFAALSRRQESLSRLATRWGWGEVTDDISN